MQPPFVQKKTPQIVSVAAKMFHIPYQPIYQLIFFTTQKWCQALSQNQKREREEKKKPAEMHKSIDRL
jgi:hypothetical protein